jgi:hypothetical protein
VKCLMRKMVKLDIHTGVRLGNSNHGAVPMKVRNAATAQAQCAIQEPFPRESLESFVCALCAG